MPKSSRGGQGGAGGAFGGFGSLSGLIKAMQNAQAANTGQGGNGNNGDDFHAGEGNSNPDFTDNNNPALVKWQQQTDEDKMARYLAKLGKQPIPPPDAEGYAYYQSPYQNMVIDMNLNAPVFAKLSQKDFNAYCKQNNLTPIYRGWDGGVASQQRFENAAMSHTGTGMYGEGFYFGSQSTGSNYSGGAVTVGALSPNARVVDLTTVRNAISNLKSSKTRTAFLKSGHTPSPYKDNIGEAQMALKMGYNVIRTSWSYVVLTRDALVIQK